MKSIFEYKSLNELEEYIINGNINEIDEELDILIFMGMHTLNYDDVVKFKDRWPETKLIAVCANFDESYLTSQYDSLDMTNIPMPEPDWVGWNKDIDINDIKNKNFDQLELEIKDSVKEFENKKYIHPLLDQITGLADFAKQSKFHIAVAEEFVDGPMINLFYSNGCWEYSTRTCGQGVRLREGHKCRLRRPKPTMDAAPQSIKP